MSINFIGIREPLTFQKMQQESLPLVPLLLSHLFLSHPAQTQSNPLHLQQPELARVIDLHALQESEHMVVS